MIVTENLSLSEIIIIIVRILLVSAQKNSVCPMEIGTYQGIPMN